MDVVEKKGSRHRLRDRGEVPDDEIDVAEASTRDFATLGTKLTVDRQTAGQPASEAMRQDGIEDGGRPAGVGGGQQRFEHDSRYYATR